jgi:WXG100 family type VII secretion target
MANVNVTFEELSASATTLRNGQIEIEGELTRLKNHIDQLVASGFVTDKASVAFQQTYESYTRGASETIQALDGLATFLEKAAEALGNTDTELANAIRS